MHISYLFSFLTTPFYQYSANLVPFWAIVATHIVSDFFCALLHRLPSQRKHLILCFTSATIWSSITFFLVGAHLPSWCIFLHNILMWFFQFFLLVYFFCSFFFFCNTFGVEKVSQIQFFLALNSIINYCIILLIIVKYLILVK